jgi:hypothetical protein
LASSWGDSWSSAWGDSWGAIAVAVQNPHAGGQTGGGRGSGRGSPGGGGDNEWYKRLRAEIEALLADPDPELEDINSLGRVIEAEDDIPQPVFDAAHEMAVSKALEDAESIADLLDNLRILDLWLAEQAEIPRLEAIEIEAEEFLLLVS